MKQTFLLFIFGLMLTYVANAQITSSGQAVDSEYADTVKIFGFCTGMVDGGELIANDSTGIGGYEYQWYKFNSTTNLFDPIGTGVLNNDSTQSVLSNLSDGGYKVVLSNGPQPQEYMAWIHIYDELELELVEYDNSSNKCEIVGILANPYYPAYTALDTFRYKDPNTLTEYEFRNRIANFNWESSTHPEPPIPNYNGPSLFTINLPWENTTYTVTITDEFGCNRTESIDYTAIATKVKFRWEYFDRKEETTKNGNSDLEDLTGPAPMEVRFFNESKNGQEYWWSFYKDTTGTLKEDSIFTTDLSFEPVYTYKYTNTEKAGKKYLMQLHSTSSAGCKDSLRYSLNVLPTKLEFPNVFSPNGDDYNEVFKLTDFQSIRNFKISIFNRVGQIVHEFDGDIFDWEGWDGKTKSGLEAPSGNYFFVFEVKGWDKKTYDNNSGINSTSEEGNTNSESIEIGVIRLFRGNN